MNEFISIIVCTYNRADLLVRTLDSLACQSINREAYEVIVVDDSSTDNTLTVCREFIDRDAMDMKILSTESNMGIAGASNLGISSAKGGHVLFTDDDCIVNRDWCWMMSRALDSENIVAGAVQTPMNPYIKLCHNVAEFHPFLPGVMAGYVDFIAGVNMGYRRSVLERLDGFFSKGKLPYAPDMDFVLRAREKGHRVYFEPKAVVIHDHSRTTLSEIISYSARHAESTILLRRKYRELLGDPLLLRSSVMLRVFSLPVALAVTARIFMRNLSNLKYLHTAPVVFATKVAWCWGAARSLRRIHDKQRLPDG